VGAGAGACGRISLMLGILGAGVCASLFSRSLKSGRACLRRTKAFGVTPGRDALVSSEELSKSAGRSESFDVGVSGIVLKSELIFGDFVQLQGFWSAWQEITALKDAA